MTAAAHHTATTAHVPAVALVNNEARLRSMLADALHERGIEPVLFGNGEELLKDPRLADYQMVISDWANSPFGGQKLFAMLAERGFIGKFVFLSSRADEIEEVYAGAENRPAGIIELPKALYRVAQEVANLARA